MNETTPAMTPARFFSAPVAETDPEIAATLRDELIRQQDGIELIASRRTSSPRPCWTRRARC
jgi:glycine hydroxymethyltransferase